MGVVFYNNTELNLLLRLPNEWKNHYDKSFFKTHEFATEKQRIQMIKKEQPLDVI